MPQGPLGTNIAVFGSANARVPLRAGAGGDMYNSSLHGDKYTQAVNQALAMGANPTPVALSAALATTYVGLCLSNPAGNTKNLVLRSVQGTLVVAPAAVLSLGLIGGYAAGGITVHTTPLTPRSALLGTGAAPTGLLDSACTLVGTPAWIKWLANNAASAGLFGFNTDLQGGIVIPPGAYVAIGSNVAGPAAGFAGSMEWEEVAPLA